MHFSGPPRLPLDIGTHFRCHATFHVGGGFRKASVCRAFEAWPVSSFIQGKPTANIHLCAGAFNGWHQCQRWFRWFELHGITPSSSMNLCADYGQKVCQAASDSTASRFIHITEAFPSNRQSMVALDLGMIVAQLRLIRLHPSKVSIVHPDEMDFIRLVVTIPDGSGIELLPVRTVDECFQLVTGSIEAWCGSWKIDLDHLFGSLPHKTLAFQQTRKRKEPSKYESALLEIVALEGSTRFLPTKYFGTIRDALIDGGFQFGILSINRVMFLVMLPVGMNGFALLNLLALEDPPVSRCFGFELTKLIIVVPALGRSISTVLLIMLRNRNQLLKDTPHL